MVSLSRSYNTNSGGATFFSESVNMDDREHLQPVLDSFGGFKPVNTVHLFSIQLIFTLALDIVAIVYAAIHPDEKSRCIEYFIVIYIHIALWFLTFVIHLITKCIHNRVRLDGYLDFYTSTETHTSLPLIVVSLWTVLLLFVQTLMQHYYPDDFAEKCINGGSLSPKAYLCALITIEFCLLFGINVSYIMKVIQFNKQQAPPDVQQGEWLASSNPETFTQNEVGYREMGSKVYDFLEKQAELIRYLKEHNARLSQKVMTLTEQLQQARSSRAAT